MPASPDLDHELYDGAGERRRQALGIDGTPGDAQDAPHSVFRAYGSTFCLVCGLAPAAKVHQR